MKECCGFKQKTKFCAHCGTLIRPDSPLDSLLAHIRKTNRAKRTAKENNPRSYVCGNLDQWEMWEIHLTALLEKVKNEETS